MGITTAVCPGTYTCRVAQRWEDQPKQLAWEWTTAENYTYELQVSADGAFSLKVDSLWLSEETKGRIQDGNFVFDEEAWDGECGPSATIQIDESGCLFLWDGRLGDSATKVRFERQLK